MTTAPWEVGDASASSSSPLDERFERGSSVRGIATTRAIFAALYEANRPLSRDELIAELVERLDAVALAYVRRCYLHKLGVRRGRLGRDTSNIPVGCIPTEIRAYLQTNLGNMVRSGTLEHDGNADPGARRYSPTSKPPRYRLSPDGPLVAYTREVHLEKAPAVEAKNREAGIFTYDSISWERWLVSLDTATLAAFAVPFAAGPKFDGRKHRARLAAFRERPLRTQAAVVEAAARILGERALHSPGAVRPETGRPASPAE